LVKTTRLGLGLFFNNSTNSGIVNYIYNIVAALHTLPQEQQPAIVLLHNDTAPVDYIKSIGYKNLTPVLVKPYPSNWLLRKLNSLVYKLTGINLFIRLNYYTIIDCFYPYFPFVNKEFAGFSNKIEWLVDFNNKAFPQHYEDGGQYINSYQEATTQQKSTIVLSSQALKDELQLYYPNYKNTVKILRFACSLPSLEGIDLTNLKRKHSISIVYFMSPNQFWEHKNQIVVFKAIQLIKEQQPQLNFKVLFTGSLEVNRGKGKYAETLIKYIEEHQLENYIQFLGILERKEQLLLMKHSIALIQPSLYEGWSTLVEEAKALNKFILLSDLPVHREQISVNVSFFNAFDANAISVLMLKELVESSAVIPFNYQEKVKQFGAEILSMLNINHHTKLRVNESS
jgi:glycosyltransferase involved in cell wall biosynthesis